MPLYRAELLTKKPLRYATLIHDVSQVLYLPFDWDDGSYARDRSGSARHGTIYGAARVGGKIGMALSHDGVDDYVGTPLSSESVGDVFSAALWVNMGRLNVSPEQDFLSCQYGPDYGWSFYNPTNTYKLHFTIKVAGTWYGITLVPSASIDTWYHLVVTFDKKTIRGYANGVAVTPVSAIGSVDKGVETLKIGMFGAGGCYTKAVIDEVRIYNRALSRDEIRMLMYRRLV